MVPVHPSRHSWGVLQSLPPPGTYEREERETPLAIAIVGRPNAGKSSLVNAITGSERAIVSDMSGTTRDAIDTEVVLPDGTPVTLIDTAGLRRRARVASSEDGAEPMSVSRAIRALRRADVVALMLDPLTGVTIQDFRCVMACRRCLCACAEGGGSCSFCDDGPCNQWQHGLVVFKMSQVGLSMQDSRAGCCRRQGSGASHQQVGSSRGQVTGSNEAC